MKSLTMYIEECGCNNILIPTNTVKWYAYLEGNVYEKNNLREAKEISCNIERVVIPNPDIEQKRIERRECIARATVIWEQDLYKEYADKVTLEQFNLCLATARENNPDTDYIVEDIYTLIELAVNIIKTVKSND